MSAQSSFYWPMRLVTEPERSALFAIYAWCRHLDDIVDGPLPPDAKAAALSMWRDYFTGEQGTVMDPDSTLVATTLGAAIAAQKLKAGLFLRLLDGLEMDLAGEMRGPSLAELEAYAHAVASAPGELCLNVLGWRGDDASQFAAVLGEAVQYTNILRDVAEDAEQDRLYVPREALDAAHIDAEDPAIVLADHRFADAWLALALMAEAKFAQAETLLPGKDIRTRIKPALAMMNIYRALWRKLRKGGWQPHAGKVTLPRWQSFLIAVRTIWLT
ncbi:MAG: squalene/phytoene synthase family protein [Rhodospirillaceae bacterium]|nr:squalene/phytoene synthase family protein [Rhodospirillaceae bacterium]